MDLKDRILAEKTIPGMFLSAATIHYGKVGYCTKDDKVNFSKKVTYEHMEEAFNFAAAIIHHGYQKGEVVAIMSNSRIEFSIMDNATTLIGAVTGGIYVTDSSQLVEYKLNHLEAKVFVIENINIKSKYQLEKALSIDRNKLPHLIKIVFIGDFDPAQDDRLISFSEFTSHNSKMDQVTEYLREVYPEDPAVIIYSSGTEDFPKGVTLSRLNINSNMRQSDEHLGLSFQKINCLDRPLIYRNTGMSILPNFQDIISKLTLKSESKHFIINYGIRNPKKGKGLGSDGVHEDRKLILTYIESLEKIYTTMINNPLSRKQPKVGKEGKTMVYLLNLEDPFTTIDLKNVPIIFLRCTNNIPTISDGYNCASAEAIHETVHVFNCLEHPLHDLNTGNWTWFDDAMAVFMETYVMKGNCDYLRFFKDWVGSPELPLDDWNARYQASMFIQYLANKMGVEFISEVWMKSEVLETPFETLIRILRNYNLEFSSSSASIKDIFASGYCLDSYFIWDHNSFCFSPQVYNRYGERAISESFIIKAGSEVATKDCLDHLACQYYRIHIKNDVKYLKVQLKTRAHNGLTPIKAEIATVNVEQQRGKIITLHPTVSEEASDTMQLTGEITKVKPDTVDHFVLVISNCGLRKIVDNPDEHDDGKEYEIKISAQ